MISKLLRKLAERRRYLKHCRKLREHRDANANSRELRNWTMNRAAAKLGWSRRQGKVA